MAYRLQPGESIRDGIRRCAVEQLDYAIDKLTTGLDDDPVDAIHTARKALKKERSLLRLARGMMRGKQRRRENGAVRDAARKLSGIRDADVMIESLDKLGERYGAQAPHAVLMTLRARLEDERSAARRDVQHDDGSDVVVRELRAARRRAHRLKLTGEGWDAIEPGLSWSYSAGREAMKQARAKPTAENLHDWRKRCKDLWYQLRLLGSISPNVLPGHADDAHLLSDLLGDDHDLAVLGDTLRSLTPAIPAELDAVGDLIQRRRGELQADAFIVGRRLYAERPKLFVRRMQRYWKSWQAELARDSRRAAEHPVAS